MRRGLRAKRTGYLPFYLAKKPLVRLEGTAEQDLETELEGKVKLREGNNNKKSRTHSRSYFVVEVDDEDEGETWHGK